MSRQKLPIALGLLLGGPPVGASDWSDSSLTYRQGNRFREPGLSGEVSKRIFTFVHAQGVGLGSTLFIVDLLQSNAADPAHGGREGAQEAYLVFRSNFESGKCFGRALAFGPIRDISLTAGFDLNAKNTTFAPRKRSYVIGPTLHFKVSGGYLDLGLWFTRETNYNGLTGQAVAFEGTGQASCAWSAPLQAGGWSGEFNGAVTYTGSKGPDGFGVATRPETLARCSLLVDVGPRPGVLRLGLGYEYWNHKFGVPNDPRLNHPTSTPMLQVELHF